MAPQKRDRCRRSSLEITRAEAPHPAVAGTPPIRLHQPHRVDGMGSGDQQQTRQTLRRCWVGLPPVRMMSGKIKSCGGRCLGHGDVHESRPATPEAPTTSRCPAPPATRPSSPCSTPTSLPQHVAGTKEQAHAVTHELSRSPCPDDPSTSTTQLRYLSVPTTLARSLPDHDRAASHG